MGEKTKYYKTSNISSKSFKGNLLGQYFGFAFDHFQKVLESR